MLTWAQRAAQSAAAVGLSPRAEPLCLQHVDLHDDTCPRIVSSGSSVATDVRRRSKSTANRSRIARCIDSLRMPSCMNGAGLTLSRKMGSPGRFTPAETRACPHMHVFPDPRVQPSTDQREFSSADSQSVRQRFPGESHAAFVRCGGSLKHKCTPVDCSTID
jgi:hypothetical protein